VARYDKSLHTRLPYHGFADGGITLYCLPQSNKHREGKEVVDHPNRYIREALQHAEENGWTIWKSGPRAHTWRVISCSFGHRQCWMAIYSTPKNPENHA
jgi:hypothetical protein